MIGFNDSDFRKVPPVPVVDCPGSIRGAFHRGISTTRSLSGNFSLVKSQENMFFLGENHANIPCKWRNLGKPCSCGWEMFQQTKGVMTPENIVLVFVSDLASIVCFLDGINTILDGWSSPPTFDRYFLISDDGLPIGDTYAGATLVRFNRKNHPQFLFFLLSKTRALN